MGGRHGRKQNSTGSFLISRKKAVLDVAVPEPHLRLFQKRRRRIVSLPPLDLVQFNLRLNGPDDTFEGSFGRLIVRIPFHCPIRLTFQFIECGDVVGATGT